MSREVILPYLLANAAPLVLALLAAHDWSALTVIGVSLLSFGATSIVFLKHKKDDPSLSKVYPRIEKPVDMLWLFLGESYLVTAFTLLSLPHIQTALDNPAAIIGLRLLILFHVLELTGVLWFRPSQLEPDSLLLYNGVAFQIAMALLLGELFLENWLFHSWKVSVSSILLIPKILLTCLGLGIRFVAFWNLGSDFDHALYGKRDERRLVTSGIHSLERHPSYVGFLVFTVGLNAVMFNPINLVLFGTALFYFYKRRIRIEERLMAQTFGEQFSAYVARVPSIFDLGPKITDGKAPSLISNVADH